jgi:hypothetical protein
LQLWGNIRAEHFHGPPAVEAGHAACYSMVLKKQGGVWEIAAFHNTLEPRH